jgi:hypothetical protein
LKELKKKKVSKLLEVIKFYADPNNWNSGDKGTGDKIRPGTKKADAYCARSNKIKGK